MGHGDDRLSPTRFLYLTISPQLLQQRLGLLQVGGVKALAEPAVDRRQQLASGITLALVLLQTGKTHSGAQLEGLGPLATGCGKPLLEAGFRLFSLLLCPFLRQ